MGGTFMSMPEDYRGQFIAQLHNALSGFTGTDVDEAVRLVLFVLLHLRPTVLNVDIPSKANQKRLASRSKRGQIIVYDPI